MRLSEARLRPLSSRHGLSAVLLVTGSALGIFIADRAAAQDAPSNPPDKAVPVQDEPPAPPPEPAPPPPVPPSASPPEQPAPEPAPPSPSSTARFPEHGPPPSVVTLEETPEAPRPPQRPAPAPVAPSSTRAFPASTPAAPGNPPAPTLEQRPPEPSLAATTSDSGEPEPRSKKEKGEGLLGPFRIGVLVGAGLPSILSFGGMIKLTRYFGAGVNVGLIPSIKLSLYGDAQLSYQEYDLYARVFPFGGMFFLGAGVGYATMKGTFKRSYDVSAFQSVAPGLPNPLSVGSEGSVRTLVLTPTLGLLQTFDSGFTLGVDLGAQIPIAPSATHFNTAVPPALPQAVVDQYVKPNDKKVQDTLDKVGHTILPTLNVRIGWLL